MGTLSISPLTPSNLRHRGKLFFWVSMTSKKLNHDCNSTGGIAGTMLPTTGLDSGCLHLPPHPSLTLPIFGSQNLQDGSTILQQEGRFPQRWYCLVSGICAPNLIKTSLKSPSERGVSQPMAITAWSLAFLTSGSGLVWTPSTEC